MQESQFALAQIIQTKKIVDAEFINLCMCHYVLIFFKKLSKMHIGLININILIEETIKSKCPALHEK